MKLFLIVALAFGLTEAGFRCTLGDWACSASCVTLGHTSGNCDPENECICSERRIDLDSFRSLVPSRCNLPFGRRVCKNTCRAVGYKEGNCVDTRYGKVNLDNLSGKVLIFSYIFRIAIAQEDWRWKNSGFALSNLFAQFTAKEYSMSKPMENAEDGIVSVWAVIRTVVRPNTSISMLSSHNRYFGWHWLCRSCSRNWTISNDFDSLSYVNTDITKSWNKITKIQTIQLSTFEFAFKCILVTLWGILWSGFRTWSNMHTFIV